MTTARIQHTAPAGDAILLHDFLGFVRGEAVTVPAGTVGLTPGTAFDHFGRMTGRVLVEFVNVEGFRFFSQRIAIEHLAIVEGR